MLEKTTEARVAAGDSRRGGSWWTQPGLLLPRNQGRSFCKDIPISPAGADLDRATHAERKKSPKVTGPRGTGLSTTVGEEA